jgi:hypothetical protein
MQQRQPRLGDILDDYCPRERRVTNHAVVAMVGADVKQTRCTTCDAEHEYKQARVPRQRRKSETPAPVHPQVQAGGPKRITHERSRAASAGVENASARTSSPPPAQAASADLAEPSSPSVAEEPKPMPVGTKPEEAEREEIEPAEAAQEEGPVHRPLIRATLPRPEGQPPTSRPAPEFTIRQPGGRAHRFRPRNPRGGQPFHDNRVTGSVAGGSRGGQRHGGGRSPMVSRPGKRQGPGHKRSK